MGRNVHFWLWRPTVENVELEERVVWFKVRIQLRAKHDLKLKRMSLPKCVKSFNTKLYRQLILEKEYNQFIFWFPNKNYYFHDMIFY